jgi:hypothetical protein
LAAPAIVRATSLMPVKNYDLFPELEFKIEKIVVKVKSRMLSATYCYEPLVSMDLDLEFVKRESGLFMPV